MIIIQMAHSVTKTLVILTSMDLLSFQQTLALFCFAYINKERN